MRACVLYVCVHVHAMCLCDMNMCVGVHGGNPQFGFSTRVVTNFQTKSILNQSGHFKCVPHYTEKIIITLINNFFKFLVTGFNTGHETEIMRFITDLAKGLQERGENFSDHHFSREGEYVEKGVLAYV